MERVDVSILGRDYSLACSPSEKEALLAAVRYVDQRMLAVKGSGRYPATNALRSWRPFRLPESFCPCVLPMGH